MNDVQIRLVEYNPEWINQYEAEKDRITAAIGPRIGRIEHIGSTAVEGLAAKPIIDITATIDKWSQVGDCIEPLETLSYNYIPESADVEPAWRYFEKRPDDGQAFNLHLRPKDSQEVEKNLLLRDYLRNHSEVAQQYEEIKRRAAAEYPDDLQAYSEAKTEFIESILDAARREQE